MRFVGDSSGSGNETYVSLVTCFYLSLPLKAMVELSVLLAVVLGISLKKLCQTVNAQGVAPSSVKFEEDWHSGISPRAKNDEPVQSIQ